MDKKKNEAKLNLASEKEKWNAELLLVNEALAFQNKEKEKLSAALLIANKELLFQTEQQAKQADALLLANTQLDFQQSEKEKRAAEFTICSNKLQKIENQFQLLVDNVKDYAIINLDAEGCVANWNSGAQYIKGYTEEDIIGKPISIFYTAVETASEKPKRDLQLALQHGRFETEGLCVKKDGSTFYANIIYTAIVDGDGLLKEYIKITKDITILKKAEQELKKINEELEQRVTERTEKLAKSEAFNMGVLNSIASQIAVLDKSGTIVAVNESWKNYTIKNGDTSLLAASVGSNYYTVCKKAAKHNIEAAGDVAQAIQGIIDEKIDNCYLEYEAHTPKAQQWFGVGITKFESDTPMVVVSHTEITERKKAEILLAERENYLRIILETEPACVKILDCNGKLVSMNPAGLAMIEADSEAQVLNTPMVDLVNHNYKTAFENLITTVFKGNSAKLEFEITGLKGRHRWLETHAVPMKNGAQIVSLLGVTQDTTERKNAEDEIAKTNTQLRQLTDHLQTVREEERKRIAREIHDDLGQRLIAIKWEAIWTDKQIPVEAVEIKEKLRHILELLDGSNQSVRKILNDLRPAVLDNNSLLEVLHWQGQQFTENTGMPVHFTTNLDGIALSPDTATCFYRIYQETITNIIRHAQASKVVSSLNRTDEYIVLSVADDGKGFDATLLEKQIGFGLLGMKERVFSLNGKFELISSPGKGTTILVSLPYNEAPKTTSEKQLT